jgi:hypothetical protein
MNKFKKLTQIIKKKIKPNVENNKPKEKEIKNNNKIKKNTGKVVKKKKENIPKAIREQVWLKYIGKKYSSKCHIVWCKNTINCFNFDCGHNIPESKGGTLRLNNLRPICRNCNVSMGANYSIDEWNSKFKPNKRWYYFYLI